MVVSAVSAWEIVIKKAAGRLDAPDNLVEALATDGFEMTLPITMAHAIAAGTLPPHHSDPFDRMLIAQACTDGLTIISVERRFDQYDVELLPLK